MIKRRNKYFSYRDKIFKFTFFEDNVIQQWETVVLESMPFQALSCKGSALVSICTSKDFDFAYTGLALTWVDHSNYATLHHNL